MENNFEEAIKKGDDFYIDEDFLSKGMSGGTRCPSCKLWVTLPRKRKNHHQTWLNVCDECQTDVLSVVFKPREESLVTRFKIKYEDVQLLIEQLYKFGKTHHRIVKK